MNLEGSFRGDHGFISADDTMEKRTLDIPRKFCYVDMFCRAVRTARRLSHVGHDLMDSSDSQ